VVEIGMARYGTRERHEASRTAKREHFEIVQTRKRTPGPGRVHEKAGNVYSMRRPHKAAKSVVLADFLDAQMRKSPARGRTSPCENKSCLFEEATSQSIQRCRPGELEGIEMRKRPGRQNKSP
jgi:hypothetical protein